MPELSTEQQERLDSLVLAARKFALNVASVAASVITSAEKINSLADTAATLRGQPGVVDASISLLENLKTEIHSLTDDGIGLLAHLSQDPESITQAMHPLHDHILGFNSALLDLDIASIEKFDDSVYDEEEDEDEDTIGTFELTPGLNGTAVLGNADEAAARRFFDTLFGPGAYDNTRAQPQIEEAIDSRVEASLQLIELLTGVKPFGWERLEDEDGIRVFLSADRKSGVDALFVAE